MKKRQSKKKVEVSRRFKIIVEKYITGFYFMEKCYTPSLKEVEYLGQRLLQGLYEEAIDLNKIILTNETGPVLAKFINDSDITRVRMQIRGDVELDFISRLQKIDAYDCAGSKIRQDKIKYFVDSLNIEMLSELDLNNSNINENALRIIVKALKLNIEKSKCLNDFQLKWNSVFDISAAELTELFNYFDDRHLIFNSHGGHFIEIDSEFKSNSTLNFYVNFEKILKPGIKTFLNRCNYKNLIVKISDSSEHCDTLIFIINLIKNLNIKSMEFDTCEINLRKIGEIMDYIIETQIISLQINIYNLNSRGLMLIIDKLKNSKIEKFIIFAMNLISFDSQTVNRIIDLPKLNCLSIDCCRLNYKLLNQIFHKIEKSKIEEFVIRQYGMKKKLANVIARILITSNLTLVELSGCSICCKQVKVIFDALQYSKVTSINLSSNQIKNLGIRYIAKTIGKTKLNSINLDQNSFNGDVGVVELLNSIKNTKITFCGIADFNYGAKNYEAIADVLLDNKILLKTVGKGSNKKIDVIMERNNNLLKKAQTIVKAYQNDTISYNYKYKKYFEAFELFNHTDILWANIQNKDLVKLTLRNNIRNNYLRISGVISNKLEIDNESSNRYLSLADLSTEILGIISSHLSISHVIS